MVIKGNSVQFNKIFLNELLILSKSIWRFFILFVIFYDYSFYVFRIVYSLCSVIYKISLL